LYGVARGAIDWENIAMKLSTLAAAAVLSAFTATAAHAQSPSGSANTCIMSHDVHDTTSPDDRTIIFRMYSGAEYKTTLKQVCPQLSFHGFAYSPAPPDEICGGVQTIKVIGSPQSCIMGPIELYTPPPKS
jgi:hypothetical protein